MSRCHGIGSFPHTYTVCVLMAVLEVAGCKTARCRRGSQLVNEVCVPIPEACNNVDEDRDGNVDEDLTMPCGTDEGTCEMGTSTCQAGVWGGCEGGVSPVVEVCRDDADNDCDGEVDESSDEVCNTVDDDCDGMIDEGLFAFGPVEMAQQTRFPLADGSLQYESLTSRTYQLTKLGVANTAAGEPLQTNERVLAYAKELQGDSIVLFSQVDDALQFSHYDTSQDTVVLEQVWRDAPGQGRRTSLEEAVHWGTSRVLALYRQIVTVDDVETDTWRIWDVDLNRQSVGKAPLDLDPSINESALDLASDPSGGMPFLAHRDFTDEQIRVSRIDVDTGGLSDTTSVAVGAPTVLKAGPDGNLWLFYRDLGGQFIARALDPDSLDCPLDKDPCETRINAGGTVGAFNVTLGRNEWWAVYGRGSDLHVDRVSMDLDVVSATPEPFTAADTIEAVSILTAVAGDAGLYVHYTRDSGFVGSAARAITVSCAQ